MNILEVKDLCKTYIVNKRQNNVLKNVNFTVSEGEMVAIMGPSGSGKSTLLYAVSGMDSITAGEVEFCGKSIVKMGEKELADLRTRITFGFPLRDGILSNEELVEELCQLKLKM